MICQLSVKEEQATEVVLELQKMMQSFETISKKRKSSETLSRKRQSFETVNPKISRSVIICISLISE